jgi:hypothetical protein
LSMCQTTKCILVVSLLQTVTSFVWCLELAWFSMLIRISIPIYHLKCLVDRNPDGNV